MGRTRKIQKALDFIEYISKPMDKSEIKLLYRINGVTAERSELYLDFIHSLFDLVISTYLGDDFLSEQDVENHFNWCWKKTITSFKKEKIYFREDSEIYEYFHSLFIESFYKEEDKSDMSVNNLMNFWLDLFNYKVHKTKSEIESFIDLYKIFNNSLYV